VPDISTTCLTSGDIYPVASLRILRSSSPALTSLKLPFFSLGEEEEDFPEDIVLGGEEKVERRPTFLTPRFLGVVDPCIRGDSVVGRELAVVKLAGEIDVVVRLLGGGELAGVVELSVFVTRRLVRFDDSRLPPPRGVVGGTGSTMLVV
jgi:hypothetical protein